MQGIKIPYHDPEVDKAAYEAWYTEGTIDKASVKLANQGILSKRGKPFSPDGLRKAAVRHMINHYEESRETLKKIYHDNGYVVEEDQIDRLMIKMAVSALHNPQRVKFWMIEHNLMEKYQEYLGSLIAISGNEKVHRRRTSNLPRV